MAERVVAATGAVDSAPDWSPVAIGSGDREAAHPRFQPRISL